VSRKLVAPEVRQNMGAACTNSTQRNLNAATQLRRAVQRRLPSTYRLTNLMPDLVPRTAVAAMRGRVTKPDFLLLAFRQVTLQRRRGWWGARSPSLPGRSGTRTLGPASPVCKAVTATHGRELLATMKRRSQNETGSDRLSKNIPNVQLWQNVNNIELWNILQDNGFADTSYMVNSHAPIAMRRGGRPLAPLQHRPACR